MTNIQSTSTPSQAPERPLEKHLQIKDLASLLNFMTLCRKTPGDWAFFSVRLLSNDKASMGEVMQVFDYHLDGQQMHALRLDERQEVFLFFSTRGKKPFAVSENDIRHSLSDYNARIACMTLTQKGIEQAHKIIAAFLPPNDMPARMALRRFARPANMFMVLDDDPLVLRQMEHMLQSYGHVETFAGAREFLTAYNKYAPNAVFVDIHLQGEHGIDVSGMLTEKVDPGAHVIMISADAVKPNIVKSKGRGARGFIGKPVNMELVMRHIMTSPTLYMKV